MSFFLRKFYSISSSKCSNSSITLTLISLATIKISYSSSSLRGSLARVIRNMGAKVLGLRCLICLKITILSRIVVLRIPGVNYFNFIIIYIFM